LRFVAPPTRCEYLPDEVARLEYLQVDRMSAHEYQDWLRDGWRRFGHVLFRPRCPSCRQCLSLRVPVASFEPHRTQRRIARTNAGAVSISIEEPSTPSPDTRALYDKFHRYQQSAKGWPSSDPDGADVFVVNPFATEEWRYSLDGRLVAVGYGDVLPVGLSAI
jgi:arginine-tRNA-protein transferase